MMFRLFGLGYSVLAAFPSPCICNLLGLNGFHLREMYACRILKEARARPVLEMELSLEEYELL